MYKIVARGWLFLPFSFHGIVFSVGKKCNLQLYPQLCHKNKISSKPNSGLWSKINPWLYISIYLLQIIFQPDRQYLSYDSRFLLASWASHVKSGLHSRLTVKKVREAHYCKSSLITGKNLEPDKTVRQEINKLKGAYNIRFCHTRVLLRLFVRSTREAKTIGYNYP